MTFDPHVEKIAESEKKVGTRQDQQALKSHNIVVSGIKVKVSKSGYHSSILVENFLKSIVIFIIFLKIL
jgi:hypothetical protein